MNSLASVDSFLPEVEASASLREGVSMPTVLDMLAFQASNAPASSAVVSSQGSLSYMDLDRCSDAVAARLLAGGLLPGQPVGVYFEGSADFIVSALGVLKAGGAYLPIDPAYPAGRAAYIMADSGAPAIITHRGLKAAAGNGEWVTYCIEDISLDAVADPKVRAVVTGDDLAYIIYTSGSTGQPKGVEITHGNLASLVNWHIQAFGIDARDRATQIAGPGFDAAVWEIWPCLAAGATLYLPSAETRVSGALLRDWLVSQQITVSFVPTVLAEQMMNLPWPTEGFLRILLTGGDALHSYPPTEIPFDVINNYGPTECTVVATSGPVNARPADHSAPAIGLPILDTAIFLLDEHGDEVPEGQAGEIYITGPSVGRGYRNRPELTAEKFVELAISGSRRRAFRTGDLARKLADGQLAFVGRTDDQIKIRGFRIEPDEIAAVINGHSAIISSAVMARSDHGEKQLVAYVVLKPEVELWEHELRELVARHLPDYMVPAHFVVLESIPVTANGKLDKTSLPAPTEKNCLKRDNYVAPRNELEEIVQGILSPILGLEKVSIHDNFFLLGGHSLMGAQVIAKVRDIFDVELNLRNVFECPTVAKLAAKIEATLTKKLEAMSEDEVHQALRAHVIRDIVSGPATEAS